MNLFEYFNKNPWCWKTFVQISSIAEDVSVRFLKKVSKKDLFEIVNKVDKDLFTNTESFDNFFNSLTSKDMLSEDDKEILSKLSQHSHEIHKQLCVGSYNESPLELLASNLWGNWSIYALFWLIKNSSFQDADLKSQNSGMFEIDCFYFKFKEVKILNTSYYLIVSAVSQGEDGYLDDVVQDYNPLEKIAEKLGEKNLQSCFKQAISSSKKTSNIVFDNSYDNIIKYFNKLEASNCNCIEVGDTLSHSLLIQYLIFNIFYIQNNIQKNIKILFGEDSLQKCKKLKNKLWYCVEDDKSSIKNIDQTISDIEKYGFILQVDGDCEDKYNLTLHKLISSIKQRRVNYSYRQFDYLSQKQNIYFAGLVKKKELTNNYNRICENLANILNLDYAILYNYNNSKSLLEQIGISDKNKTSTIKDIRDEKDKEISISYNALNLGSTKLIYALNENGKYYPPDETIYGNNNKKIKGAISTPIRFKGRKLGVIELITKNNWRVYNGQNRQTVAFASQIAPFIYRQKYLSALKNIQQSVSDYTGLEKDDKDIYTNMASELCNIFLVKTCKIWKHNANGNIFFDVLVETSTKRIEEFELDYEKPELQNYTVKNGILFVVLFDKNKNPTGILEMFSCETDTFDGWQYIIQFISSQISFMLDAINDLESILNPLENSLNHQLFYDAKLLKSAVQKLFLNHNKIPQTIDFLQEFLQHKKTKNFMEISYLLGDFEKKSIENLQELPFNLNTGITMPYKETLEYATSIVERLDIDMSIDTPPKDIILTRELNYAIGDKNIVRTIMNAVKEETRWINLRDKVNEIITKLSGKYPAYISNEVNKDYQIKTNAKLLNIILSNLIINAKKYSIKNTAITIKTTEYRTGLEFVIENIARPIERAEIYKLTHKNFRGSNTENFDDGVGLGLYEVNLLTRHTPMANIFIKPLDYKITKISDLEASFIFTVEFMEFKKQ
jgi:hypothetical protein